MEHTMKNQKSFYLFILIASLILGANYSVMSFELFAPVTDVMIIATTLDLTLVLPFFFYLLVIKGKRSILSVLPVIIIGFWIAYFIVPHHDLALFDYTKYTIYCIEVVFICIEAVFGIFLLRKIPKLITHYRVEKETHYFFPAAIRGSLIKTFGEKKWIRFLSFDLTVFYYGLFAWKREWSTRNDVQSFSIHKETGYFGVFLLLVHVMVVEVIGVHFLILQWSHTAAWIFTAFDLFTLLLIIADYQAIRLSPVVIKDNHMRVQIGIRREIEVSLDNIEAIGPTTTEKKQREREKQSFSITLPNFIEEDPQFEIHLKEPVVAHLPYGITKKIKKLYVTVDEKSRFFEVINERMNLTSEDCI